MDTYSHLVFFVGWPDTGALMRRLDDRKSAKDGKPGQMYRYLGNTEDERQRNLSIFKSWVGSWTLKKWSEVTKEEIEAMTLLYEAGQLCFVGPKNLDVKPRTPSATEGKYFGAPYH